MTATRASSLLRAHTTSKPWDDNVRSSVDRSRRELFYWATVLTTFALGTAVGDLTAFTLHLGFLRSGLVFAGVILLPALAYRFVGLNGIAAFWSAYIVTRPLGASLADWMGTPKDVGGLNLGRGNVSLVLAASILVLVLTVSRRSVATPTPRFASG